jgi:hypothetical protein
MLYDELFLCDSVRDVVQAVKRKPEGVATAAVEMVLRRKRVRAEQFKFVLNRVMEQAAALYENWPVAV